MNLKELEEAYLKDFSGSVLEERVQLDPEGQRQAIAEFLRAQLGKPFNEGFSSYDDREFDCSGLAQQAYRAAGISIPRTSINQATFIGRPVEKHEDLQVGDLFFFRSNSGYFNELYPDGIGHVAIVSGEGIAIQARYRFGRGPENRVVAEETIDYLMGQDDLVVIKRIIE
jgi:cell wall-associated NlpC family hydrolase